MASDGEMADIAGRLRNIKAEYAELLGQKPGPGKDGSGNKEGADPLSVKGEGEGGNGPGETDRSSGDIKRLMS